MGGSSSKRSVSAQSSSAGSNSYSWDHNRYAQPSYAPSYAPPYAPPYAPSSQNYAPQQHYAPPPQGYGGHAPESKRRLERKYSKIDDNYNSLDQVTLYL